MNSHNSLSVCVPVGRRLLQGDLESPLAPHGLVLFAHGSGSSRHSPRNQYVAGVLKQQGFATLLIDLLTEEEEAEDDRSERLRFDIEMLAERLVTIVDWLRGRPETAQLPIGLFGASTGGAAALVAAAMRPHEVDAVVSRGGPPRSGRSRVAACISADLAHRRRSRYPRDRNEPRSAGAHAGRGQARHRARRNAPFRRAWCSRTCRDTGRRLVQSPP